jgi:hypothetical protein
MHHLGLLHFEGKNSCSSSDVAFLYTSLSTRSTQQNVSKKWHPWKASNGCWLFQNARDLLVNYWSRAHLKQLLTSQSPCSGHAGRPTMTAECLFCQNLVGTIYMLAWKMWDTGNVKCSLATELTRLTHSRSAEPLVSTENGMLWEPFQCGHK